MKVSEVFAKAQPSFGTVPPVERDFVCRFCLGPNKPEYAQCPGCYKLLLTLQKVGQAVWVQVPGEIGTAIVPMTAALSPSPWYSYLYQYKRGYLDHYGPIVAALAHTYLSHHEDDIATLLGGAPSIVTIVPSKRGFSFNEQPFRKALALVPVGGKLRHTLTFVNGEKVERWQYNPSAFAPGPVTVHGERVVLLDDTWVTGATSVSAAGALIREGAESVAILPLARKVDIAFWTEEHAYLQAMKASYDPSAWPR